MSRHEGVSCDSCLKGNFRGRRYKCLVCYDYDLCGACYDGGSTTTRHTTEHPMQCILTRNDLELYYEGEALEQQQAFTCPFCGKMGYTESLLHEHVTADHTVATFEVVCPICAAQPGGDPNLITDDFASHLSLEHRTNQRGDLISFMDEPSGSRQSVRRIPHPTRGVGSSRNRNRSNMHFSNSSGNATSSLSSRDSVDPIAELLSQLSGVRRSTGSNSSTSQLAHIQMQLQLERQQVRAARQQLERLPRRQNQSSSSGSNHAGNSTSNSHNSAGSNSSEPSTSSGQNKHHEFLLPKLLNELNPEVDWQTPEHNKQLLAAYTQEVLLGSLRAGIGIGPNPYLASLLPKFGLMRLGTSSDEQGVTNISVDNTENRFQPGSPLGRDQTAPSCESELKSQSEASSVTRTISTSPGSTDETTENGDSEASTHTGAAPSRAKFLFCEKANPKTTDINTIRRMVWEKYMSRQKNKSSEE